MKKRVSKKVTLEELGDQMSFIVKHMATKDDIRALRAELKTDFKTDVAGIMNELSDIKRRLKALEELVTDHAGHSKEIDHALARIRAIEKHLGIKPVNA